MRYYIGVDLGDREHRVWVGDDTGTQVVSRTVVESAEGFAEWGRWLDEHRSAGSELWAALERPDGRLVDFLLEHGVVVFALNPKALDRARDRFRVSGSKSDPFDARVAAEFLRTDHAQLHALRPSSEEAQELKALTRDYARQVRQQTRVCNQVTVTLKEYYPRALDVCDDLTARWAQEFLQAYPTPVALAAVTERRWHGWARRQLLSAARIAELWTTIAAPQLPVPAHVVRVKSRRLTVLLAQLQVTIDAVESYRKAVEDFFAALPGATWAATLPAGKSGTTVPTVWAELGDAAGRWESARHLQAHAGAIPVTKQSGKARSVGFRFACNKHLRAAMQQFAFLSLRQSAWARAYYDRCRARGHEHQHALRALAAKWLKIIFVMWSRRVGYDEQHHLANIARHHLRQPA
jgi:transposase